MHRAISRKRLWFSALFVAGALAIGVTGVYVVASRQWRVQPTFLARGVRGDRRDQHGRPRPRPGDRRGRRRADQALGRGRGGLVTLWFRIDERLHNLIRSDARAQIASQGVVGVEGHRDPPWQARRPAAGRIRAAWPPTPRPSSPTDRDASASLRRIDTVAVAAEKGLTDINSIVASIREGKGSVGRLVADEEVYRRLLALSDRGLAHLGDLEDNPPLL